jgi:hypothetical protein
MIRSASLALVCAFGLSNIAQASLAATQLDTSNWTFSLAPADVPPLAPTTTPVIGGNVPLGSSGGSGSSLNITNLNFDQITGNLYGELVGAGGNLSLHQDTPTTVIDNGLILADVPTTSTVTVTAPVTEPFEPPEGGWVTPPGFLSPAPVYPQQAGMACSGAFSVTFGNQITVNCQADLWFTNGFVAAGQSIQANALGSILVDNVSFAAPLIQFNAGGNFITSLNPMWLDGQTTINAQYVGLAGPVQVSSTGSLTINTPAIPEPGTWALMGLGLVGLSLAARRKA